MTPTGLRPPGPAVSPLGEPRTPGPAQRPSVPAPTEQAPEPLIAGPVGELAGRALVFEAGIPGFPFARTFVARPWGPQPSPFVILESQEMAGLRFVAVPPRVFFPDYQPKFGPEVFEAVDAAGPEELLLLVILSLHSRPLDTTANLLGPLVVNARTGQARQSVLSGSGYSAQAPLAEKA